MRENSPAERLYNGIIKENPTFVLVLGMCPTLQLQQQPSTALAWDLLLQRCS